MDNIKATNNCGIYLDEFCNRETLNINKKYKLEIIIKIAYDPNDKFYRYGIGCMHNSSSGWGFGYAPGKDDKKYLTVEEAKQAAIIEIADRHSYCCFGKTLRDILIEAGYLQAVNSISLWD